MARAVLRCSQGSLAALGVFAAGELAAQQAAGESQAPIPAKRESVEEAAPLPGAAQAQVQGGSMDRSPATAQQARGGKNAPPGTRERSELVVAARSSAVDELLRAVESQSIRTDLTVKQLLEALGAPARRELRSLLGTSAQLGGPRFPSAGTAEVQLQADGTAILDKLAALAGSAGEKSPIAVDELEARLASWRRRSFTATGGSASSTIGPELRARPELLPPAWAGVSEEARRNAFLQARDSAVNQYLEATAHIEVLDNIPAPAAESTDVANNGVGAVPAELPRPNPLTLRKAFAAGSVEQEARQWLSERPVSRLMYTADRQIEVKLAVEPEEWAQQLRVSMSRPEQGLPEIGDEDWQRLIGRLSDSLGVSGAAEVVGRATAAETERLPTRVELPPRIPEWTRQPLAVRTTAAPAAGAAGTKRRLETRQAAYVEALKELRVRLEALSVGDQQTLGDLSRSNAAIRDLLEASMPAARITHTEYHTDDSVTVEVALNARVLWQVLERQLVPASSDEVPAR